MKQDKLVQQSRHCYRLLMRVGNPSMRDPLMMKNKEILVPRDQNASLPGSEA